jgi:LDH2 family malate/lactate/ureidoglycolate dehydrogenase
MSDRDEYVAPATWKEFARRALVAAGMPDEDAETTAAAMLWADLRGLDAHGVNGKLAQCVARIRAGGTRANPALPVGRERAATATIDGQNAWGQVAAVAGMRGAIAKAKASGIGAVSVRDVSSAAALGYYPTLAVAERMIGVAITNGPALIAPSGGTTRLLGNQAHAIGCPSRRHFPILFDSAMSVMSTGEMDLCLERGELLPEGVLLDAAGQPTRDPARWKAGLLVPIGGHRGYGLSLMFEVLTGVLAGGARMGPDIGHPFDYAQPQGVSLFLLAIDPELAMPIDTFLDRVDHFIDRVHATPRAPGVDRVYVPGERGYLTAQQRERDGIPLPAERAGKLKLLAAELGVPAW